MKMSRKNSVKRLSESDTLKLVEIYKKSECLWNNECPDYKNKSKRDECYFRIQNEFGLGSIEGVKKKIKSIRDTFTAEKNKMIKSYKSGVSADEIYKTKLIWYDTAASFLLKGDNRISCNNLIEFLSVKDEKDSMIEAILQDHQESNSCPHLTDQTISVKPLKTKQKTKEMLPPKRKRRKLQKDYVPKFINTALNKLEELKESATQDQYYYFGQYIACQLRDLPKLSGVQLQAEIQNLITKKRLELCLNDKK